MNLNVPTKLRLHLSDQEVRDLSPNRLRWVVDHPIGSALTIGSMQWLMTRAVLWLVIEANVPWGMFDAMFLCLAWGLWFLVIQNFDRIMLRSSKSWSDLFVDREQEHFRIQHSAALGLAQMTIVRDHHSERQITRMGRIVQILVDELARDPAFADYLTPTYRRDLVLAAPLHDIGRVGLPDSLLEHRGSYSSADEEMMRQHVVIGGDLLGRMQVLLPEKNLYRLAQEIAYHHHQRWDGMGYPGVLKRPGSVQYFVQEGLAKPLRGEAIPLSARIVAVADAYNAMRVEKPNRSAKNHKDTLQEIFKATSEGAFDPRIVEALVRCERELTFVIDGQS